MHAVRFGFLALGLLVGFASQAHAALRVASGVYEVPALVVRTETGLAAVFNPRSLSQCRIVLTGDVAAKVAREQNEGPRGYVLKFEIREGFNANQATATLLGAEPLKGRKIPVQVGHNLKPLSE
jgi:hypothetical protein